ncbi:MAG: aspartyl protease family protein [Candidatus Bathyarchaeia archaeon]
MGYVRVKGLLGNAQGVSVREVEFLTDTGAFYTVIPPSLAKELSVEPSGKTRLTLVNKRIIEADVSLAYIKILDREGVLPVVIMDAPEPLLSATALEGLGLRVDPATGRVEHSRSYGLAVL